MKKGTRLLSFLLSFIITFSLAGASVGTASAADYCIPKFTEEDFKAFTDTLNKVYGAGYPTGEVTLSCAKDAAVLCGMCSATPEYSIGIGQLSGQDGYIVILGGTDLRASDENVGIEEDLLSAMNKKNGYYKSVLREIHNNIPAGSDIYIYGYSLGGMVLQQVIADGSIKNNYHIVNGVAFGSPMTTLKRSRIVFLEDSSDIVPLLAPRFVIGNELWKKYDTHIVRDGGYKSFIGGHVLSYIDSPVWNHVDIFGVIGGSGTLTVDMDTYHTFKA